MLQDRDSSDKEGKGPTRTTYTHKDDPRRSDSSEEEEKEDSAELLHSDQEDPTEYCIGGYHPVKIGSLSKPL